MPIRRLVLPLLLAAAPLASSAADAQLPWPRSPGDLVTVDRTATLEDGVVHLDARSGDGIAWLPGASLSSGRVTVEIRGLDKPGASFVGLAFHGQDDETFDVVYLRPFNFHAPDPARRARAVQYMSMPAHPWQLLRQKFPGRYEAGIPDAPAADAWVRLTLEIAPPSLRVFVNDGAEPVLTVALLGEKQSGKLGLWVGNDSEGWFRR